MLFRSRHSRVVPLVLLVAGLLLLGPRLLGQTAGAVEPAHQHGAAGAGHAHAAGHGAFSGSVLGLLIVYSLLVIGASLLGGWLPSLVRLTHTRMQFMISFVGGLMLGIGVFHMLPHALVELGPGGVDTAALAMMAGIVTMFFMLRAFHFHQHEPVELTSGAEADVCDHGDEPHAHSHHPAHDHGHGHAHGHGAAHELSWLGVFLGLALHTLIDGMALGASVQVESAEASQEGLFWLFGLGTFAAILLHKPLDAVSITSLMTAAGWSRGWKLFINILFAGMCPLGAALFLLGVRQLFDDQALALGIALAFAAGVFACIALSDLLPEMEFHSHHRIWLSLTLIAGIAMAWGIRYLEPAHTHEPRPATSAPHAHDHDHDHAH